MPDQPSPTSSRPVPERFLASKSTLLLDRFMTRAIQIGGLGIIVAVFGIFFFILMEILPLFGGAEAHEEKSFPLGITGKGVIGVDEWARKPFFFDGNSLRFADLEAKDARLEEMPVPLPEGVISNAIKLEARHNRVVIGTTDGRIGSFRVGYKSQLAVKADDLPAITAEVTMEEFYPLGVPGKPLTTVSYGDGGAAKVLAAVQDVDGTPQVHAMTIVSRRGLMGSSAPTVGGNFDLTPFLKGKPDRIMASNVGDSVMVTDTEGRLYYFHITNGTNLQLRQELQPFSEFEDKRIASIGFVFGDVSVVVTSMEGHQEVWSLYNQEITNPEGIKQTQRLYGQIKTLPKLENATTFFANSLRNKVFMSAGGDYVSMRHTTSESVRWEKKLPFQIKDAILDSKCEHLFFLDTEGTLHRYLYHDPHPESGIRAFFGKIWYEGASQPEYTWQSTSGTDDFEPKLSLIPLIVGSLKGTFYALIFAVPIALLAAIYSANFLPQRIKTIVKPAMEIMASLPSVVLGFLAGLWLAPLIEDKIPSILLTIISLPIGVMILGLVYTKLPVGVRAKVPVGSEYLLLLIPMALLAWIAWSLGPWLESWAFVVTDPGTGRSIADFRLWWPNVTGTPYDQRNCVSVGFMMGFAVIPIIFTITEDALSNVPPQLKAASLALGATRWQMVRTIVLPIASAGIFSALMIGFGRAVGETMIVVMAAGNTPIIDMSIFTGMRTLSANIAVELPEAPVHSTHYRVLFLGAMVLFMLTFALNTVAEIMRHRLREKFKLV
ncbi:ABC transporter permease subunit [Phragmitibacter flavus]|nr:ABC transporter permease subunit [Phragmitibacter flavus]